MVIGLLGCGSFVAAQVVEVPEAGPQPAPFPSVEKKTVTPPAAGTRHRITVQINRPSIENAPERASVDVMGAEVPTPDVDLAEYKSFWDRISPSLADTSAGRLDRALATVAKMPKVPRPSLQTMQDIATAQGINILTSTVGTNVSPALVLAMISVESAGKQRAVSHAGAEGLMQLMPATAARFDVDDSFDPASNIKGGVAYLDWLMEEFGRDPILVLAGYNAGEGSIRKHDGVPPYAETRDYVPKVLAAFEVARALCSTPPDLISDGCVFVTMR